MPIRMFVIYIFIVVFGYHVTTNYLRRPLTVDRADVQVSNWLVDFVEIQQKILRKLDPNSFEYLMEIYRLVELSRTPIQAALFAKVDAPVDSKRKRVIESLIPFLFPFERAIIARKFDIGLDQKAMEPFDFAKTGPWLSKWAKLKKLEVSSFIKGKGTWEHRLSSLEKYDINEIYKILISEKEFSPIEQMKLFVLGAKYCDPKILKLIESLALNETSSINQFTYIDVLRKRNDSWARELIQRNS